MWLEQPLPTTKSRSSSDAPRHVATKKFSVSLLSNFSLTLACCLRPHCLGSFCLKKFSFRPYFFCSNICLHTGSMWPFSWHFVHTTSSLHKQLNGAYLSCLNLGYDWKFPLHCALICFLHGLFVIALKTFCLRRLYCWTCWLLLCQNKRNSLVSLPSLFVSFAR